jgi:Trypsin-like peptidase domain
MERPQGSEVFVRLMDSYLRSIVYLGFPHPDKPSAIDPAGTGFLLSYDESTYIVTAAHVAKQLTEVPFGIRLNREGDGLGQVDYIESARWYLHPDDTVDVAVIPYKPPRWARVKFVWGKYIMSDFKRETKDIGVGDLAYVVGILKALRAKDKNVPVVHTGHIASMADGEKIPTTDWRSNAENPPLLDIDAYLVQAPTMPQSSGSPVFVRRTINSVLKTETESLRTTVAGSVWLLGLWHGAWINDVSTLLQVSDGSVTVGTGMGLCIPAPKIIQVLQTDELMTMRQKWKDSAERQYIVQQQAGFKAGFKKATADIAARQAGDDILRAALNTTGEG